MAAATSPVSALGERPWFAASCGRKRRPDDLRVKRNRSIKNVEVETGAVSDERRTSDAYDPERSGRRLIPTATGRGMRDSVETRWKVARDGCLDLTRSRLKHKTCPISRHF
jgi:hypothetical protein